LISSKFIENIPQALLILAAIGGIWSDQMLFKIVSTAILIIYAVAILFSTR
jgi:hypothetical protein